MLDKRIYQHNDYAARLQANAESIKRIEEEEWFPEAVNRLQSWLVDLVNTHHGSDQSISDYVATLDRGELPGKELACIGGVPLGLADNINALLQQQDGSNESQWVYATALAGAIGVMADTLQGVLSLWKLTYSHSLVWYQIRYRLKAIFSNDIKSKESFFDCCHQQVVSILNSVGDDYCIRDPDIFISNVNAFKSQKSFFTVVEWETMFGGGIYHYSRIEFFDVVRLLDINKYVELLEKIEIPHLFFTLLSNCEIENSFEEHLLLLQASLKYAMNNKSQNTTLVPLLLNKIHYSLGRIENFYKDCENGTDLLEKEVSKVVRVLSENDDYFLHSFYWITYLISTDGAAHNNSGSSSMVSCFLVDGISESIFAKNFSFNECLEYFYSLDKLNKERKTRLDMSMSGLYALLAIFVKEEPIGLDLRRKLLEAYEWSLRISRFGLRTGYSGHSLGYADYSVGLLLLQADSSDAEWLRIWNGLSELRRAALFYSYTKETYATSPDLTHAYAGLSCIEWLISKSPEKNVYILKFWKLLLRVCIQQNEIGFQDNWKLLILALFARLPLIVENIPNKSEVDMLYIECLKLLGGDSELWVAACDSLIRNGAKLNVFDVESRNSIEHRIQSYLTWRGREGGRKSQFDLSKQAIDVLGHLKN